MAAALLYVAVAVALLLAAHRWVRAIGLAAAATLVVVPLCFTGRALLTGRVYGPLDLAFRAPPLSAHRVTYGMPPRARNPALADVFSQILPWQQAVRRAWSAGEWPLMNPAILCGDPLQGTAQSAPYHPFNLLSYAALSPAAAPTFVASATLFLAALSAFLFLREIGCSAGPALLGAGGWAWSDFVGSWVGWPLGLAVVVFPLVLLAVERVARAPGARSTLLLGVALLLSLLAGHPETTVHLVGWGTLYGLGLLAGRGWRAAGRALAGALAAGALVLLIAAIYLLPISDVLDQSQEMRVRSRHYATADRSVPWRLVAPRLLPNWIPFAYGRPGFPPTERAPAGWSNTEGYAGSLLYTLALAGMAVGRGRRRWILFALGLLGLLANASAPGVADLLARIPFFEVAINERLAFAWAFTVAALAGLGAQELVTGGAARRMRNCIWGGAMALAALLALALPNLDGAIEAPHLVRHVVFYVAPLLMVSLLLLDRSALRFVPPVLILLLAAQRLGEAGAIYPVYPARAFYPAVPPLTELPRGGAPYRIVGLNHALIPNLSTMWGLEDVRGNQALTLARLTATYPLWSVRQSAWFNNVPDLERPFLGFLNVRYALAGSGDDPPAGWRVANRVHGQQVLENKRWLPRAFVPPRVRVGGSWAQVRSEMEAEVDFSRRAWIELPGQRRGPLRGRPNGPGRVLTARDGSGYHLEVEMVRRGYVVTSIAAWRGWRALSEGQELQLAFANHAFVAIEVPPGRHRVRLFYLPESFVWGRRISFAALAGLALWALARRALHRRASA